MITSKTMSKENESQKKLFHLSLAMLQLGDNSPQPIVQVNGPEQSILIPWGAGASSARRCDHSSYNICRFYDNSFSLASRSASRSNLGFSGSVITMGESR